MVRPIFISSLRDATLVAVKLFVLGILPLKKETKCTFAGAWVLTKGPKKYLYTLFLVVLAMEIMVVGAVKGTEEEVKD
jgi:hypothetical protein